MAGYVLQRQIGAVIFNKEVFQFNNEWMIEAGQKFGVPFKTSQSLSLGPIIDVDRQYRFFQYNLFRSVIKIFCDGCLSFDFPGQVSYTLTTTG